MHRIVTWMLALAASVAVADVPVSPESYRDQHPLEQQALVDPDAVLAALGPLREQAERADNLRELARLALAEANACRVQADWFCQRRAGSLAAEAAQGAGDDYLVVRGLIVSARGHAAMQDFNSAEQALGEASSRLRAMNEPALRADVALAYSSISASLGKSELAVRYAASGISELPAGLAVPLRVRLLRNLAKSAVDLRRFDEARAALDEALGLVVDLDDPKLRGEIWLEHGRLALARSDAGEARRMATQIGKEAELLQNSQLGGLSLELAARAALLEGNKDEAAASLEAAATRFRALDLYRDEFRVVRELARLRAEDSGSAAVQAVTARLNELSEQVTRREREVATDDFEDRLRYVEQEAELVRAKANAEADRKLAESATRASRLSRTIAIGSVATVLALAVLYLMLRRTAHRLRIAEAQRVNALLRVSHDLRNPINGIVGLCASLRQRELDGPTLRLVGSIESAAQGMGALAQDLLDHGQLERGKLGLRPRSVALGANLRDFAAQYQARAEARGLVFRLQVDSNLPDLVKVDVDRLQQVLGNLLGNALKFTTSGHVGLQLRVMARDGQRAEIEFTVDDSGAGISAEELKRLFRPFEKGEHGEQHRSGAGLGLSISQELVTLMGGRIEASSQPGRGTRFVFRLQLPIVYAETTPVPVQDDTAGGIRGRRVLLVDDDALNREFHGLLLGAMDCSVVAVENGSEARRVAAAEDFDACLVDYELPDGSGTDLARDLRAMFAVRGRTVRMIAVSGLPPGAAQGREAVDDWVMKPTSLERLREALGG